MTRGRGEESGGKGKGKRKGKGKGKGRERNRSGNRKDSSWKVVVANNNNLDDAGKKQI